MTSVQIDKYYCEVCNKQTKATLDIRAGVYTCLNCGNEDKNISQEEDIDIKELENDD